MFPDADAIGRLLEHPGQMQEGVYTITLPRADVDVDIEGMRIPPAALVSTFRFYRCHCGKNVVAGEFCLRDYEVNDVIDALRKADFRIACVGEMFVGEKPRMMLVRFQGEADGLDIGKPIVHALQFVGEARTEKNKAR